MSSSSQRRRQRGPLPVIDLAQVLGPNFRQRFTPVRRLNQNVASEPNQPQQQGEEESNVARMPESNISSEASGSRDNNTGDLKPAAKSKSSMSLSSNGESEESSRAWNMSNQDTRCRKSTESKLWRYICREGRIGRINGDGKSGEEASVICRHDGRSKAKKAKDIDRSKRRCSNSSVYKGL